MTYPVKGLHYGPALATQVEKHWQLQSEAQYKYTGTAGVSGTYGHVSSNANAVAL